MLAQAWASFSGHRPTASGHSLRGPNRGLAIGRAGPTMASGNNVPEHNCCTVSRLRTGATRTTGDCHWLNTPRCSVRV